MIQSRNSSPPSPEQSKSTSFEDLSVFIQRRNLSPHSSLHSPKRNFSMNHYSQQSSEQALSSPGESYSNNRTILSVDEFEQLKLSSPFVLNPSAFNRNNNSMNSLTVNTKDLPMSPTSKSYYNNNSLHLQHPLSPSLKEIPKSPKSPKSPSSLFPKFCSPPSFSNCENESTTNRINWNSPARKKLKFSKAKSDQMEDSEQGTADVDDNDETGYLSLTIPRFYFPKNQTFKSTEENDSARKLVRNVRRIFAENDDIIHVEQFAPICELLLEVSPGDLFAHVFFYSTNEGENVKAGRTLSWQQFEPFFQQYMVPNPPITRLFHLLRNPVFNKQAEQRMHLIPSDFSPLLQVLLDMHEGLAFLKATPAFQDKYAQTVILRIFFSCTGYILRARSSNSSTSIPPNHMALNHREFLNRKIGQILLQLPTYENFPNEETHFFSYEQFYVIYVHFWELDSDHDFEIKLNQMGFTEYCMQRIKQELKPYSKTDNEPAGELVLDYNNFVQLFLAVNDPSDCYGSFEFWWQLFTPEKTGFIHLPTLKQFWNSLQQQIHENQLLEIGDNNDIDVEMTTMNETTATNGVSWSVIERQIKDLWNINDLNNIPKNGVKKDCLGETAVSGSGALKTNGLTKARNTGGLGCNVFLMLSSVNGWMDMERTGGGVRKSFAEWAAGEYERLAAGDEDEETAEVSDGFEDNYEMSYARNNHNLNDDQMEDEDVVMGEASRDRNDYNR